MKKKYYYNPGEADVDELRNIYFSRNNKFFAICYKENDRKIENHHFVVFNDKFEQIYSYNFNKKIKNKLYQIKSIRVDDSNGTLYFVSKAYEKGSKKDKVKGKINYHYELHRISKTENTELTIKLGKHFVKDLFFGYDDNYMVCAGYYSDKDKDKVKGVCRFNIDRNSMKILKTYYIPFTKKYYLDKYGKIKNKETEDLKLRDVYLTESGAIIFNGEEEYEGKVFTSFDATSIDKKKRKYVKFEDLFMAKIDVDGKVIWMRDIKKSQNMTRYDTYSFYSTAVNGNSYILLNAKKFKKKSMKFYGKTGSKSNVFLIEISGKGKIRIKKILDKSENIIPMMLMDGVLVNKESTIVFLGEKGKNAQFTKVKIEDLVF